MRGRARKKTDRYPVSQCALYKVRGLQTLGDLLFASSATLEDFGNRHSEVYREWDIPTKSGKLRHIEHPIHPLKQIHGRLETLLMRLDPPSYLFCPVKGRDFLMNALEHWNQRAVWRVDVKDYFASTRASNVLRFYRDRLACAGDVATVLTKVSTFHGHIPTGSPLSPILSFFANEPMWESIRQECAKYGCTISLYMDDLTVSGHAVPWTLRRQILDILNANGFKGHKCEYAVGRPALVTGLISGSTRPQLPHSHYKKFRKHLELAEGLLTPDEYAKVVATLNGLMKLRSLAQSRVSRARGAGLRRKAA